MDICLNCCLDNWLALEDSCSECAEHTVLVSAKFQISQICSQFWKAQSHSISIPQIPCRPFWPPATARQLFSLLDDEVPVSPVPYGPYFQASLAGGVSQHWSPSSNSGTAMCPRACSSYHQFLLCWIPSPWCGEFSDLLLPAFLYTDATSRRWGACGGTQCLWPFLSVKILKGLQR